MGLLSSPGRREWRWNGVRWVRMLVLIILGSVAMVWVITQVTATRPTSIRPLRGGAVTQHEVYYLGDIFLPQEILHEALHTFLGSKSPDWEGNKAKMSALSAGGCNSLGRAYKKN